MERGMRGRLIWALAWCVALAVGIVMLMAGLVTYPRVHQPYLDNTVLIDRYCEFVPDKARQKWGKYSYCHSPEVFLHGTKYNILVYVRKRVTRIDYCVGLPMAAHIESDVSAEYVWPAAYFSMVPWHREEGPPPPALEPDVRDLVLAEFLRELPSYNKYTPPELRTGHTTITIENARAQFAIVGTAIGLVFTPLGACGVGVLRLRAWREQRLERRARRVN